MNTLIKSNVKFNFIQLTSALIGEVWITNEIDSEEYFGEIVTYMN